MPSAGMSGGPSCVSKSADDCEASTVELDVRVWVERGLRSLAVATDAERVAASQRRFDASERWRPHAVDLLIVAQTPPLALDRYFYFEDVVEQDSLFRYVVKGFTGSIPSRVDKAISLTNLRNRGVFLIDVKVDPYDPSPLRALVDDVVVRCEALSPRAIVLVKADVYDAAFVPLKRAHLPVVDVRVPFPGSGQQRNFEAAFAQALAAAGIKA